MGVAREATFDYIVDGGLGVTAVISKAVFLLLCSSSGPFPGIY
jgi:hypothetical protein